MPKIDQWSVCVADCIGGRTGMVAVTAIVWQLALLCNLFQKLSFFLSFLPLRHVSPFPELKLEANPS